MDKKGFSLHWIHMYYLLLLVVILLSLTGRIKAAADDTEYNLKFYSRDIAYGVESFLWSDLEGEYIYPLKEGYEINIDDSIGIVKVNKGISKEEYSFRIRKGYEITSEKTQKEGLRNPYLIKKNKVEKSE